MRAFLPGSLGRLECLLFLSSSAVFCATVRERLVLTQGGNLCRGLALKEKVRVLMTCVSMYMCVHVCVRARTRTHVLSHM